MKYYILFMSLFCSLSVLSQEKLNAILLNDFGQGTVKFIQTKTKEGKATSKFKACTRDNKVGNCAAMALIKGAIAEFRRFDSIFKEVSFTYEAIHVTLADNYRLSVSQREIDTVKQLSGIKSKKDSLYYDTASILYALLAKRIQLDTPMVNKILGKQSNTRCIESFTNAVEYLNSGFKTSEVYRLLGLGKQPIPINQVTREPYAIIWCDAHAAYSHFGLHDYFGGQPKKISKGKMRNLIKYDKINAAYKLRKP